MNTTTALTVLGIFIGVTDYASKNQIYPQYTGPASMIAIGIAGILAKGVDKR